MNLSRYTEKDIEKIGFLDIETHGTGFNANDTYLVSWVIDILDTKTKKINGFYDIINKAEIKAVNRKAQHDTKTRRVRPYDKRILKSLVDTMLRCDLIVGHYSNYFDVPMIRTRCAMQDLDFIRHSDKIKFADTWVNSRFGMKFRRNTLDNVSKSLNVKTKKTYVDYWNWVNGCTFGNPKSLKYILDHNCKDVIVTRKVWEKIEAFKPIPARYY